MKLKVLELFSGIGGMHFACKEAERLTSSFFQFDIIGAADINTSANSVYNRNFPDTKLMAHNIQDMNSELIALQPDVLLMSPPCQPFTRTGLKKDLCDPRCSALSHLTNIIPSITSLQYILLENVKGFELSQSRQAFVDMLSSTGFIYVECLLSPTQFGVPNSRTRYYLIAKKCEQSTGFGFPYKDGELITEVPKLLSTSRLYLPSLSPLTSNMTLSSILDTRDIGTTLYTKYMVSRKDLAKRFNVLDIVNTGCSSTNCFTSAYTRYAEGTGSVLSNLENMDTIEQIINLAKQLALKGEPLEKRHDNADSNQDGESKAKRIKLENKDTETVEKGSEQERSDTKTDNPESDVKDIESNDTVSKPQIELPRDKQHTERESEAENVLEDVEKVDSENLKELKKKQVTGKDAETSLIDHETRKENDGEEINTSTHGDKTAKKTIMKTTKETEKPNIDSKRQLEKSEKDLKTTTYDNKSNNGSTVQDTSELLELLDRLNLRYFTPNEIRKLMCFPEEFKFPDTCSDKSRYKLLGNSINVHVVAYCICLMLS